MSRTGRAAGRSDRAPGGVLPHRDSFHLRAAMAREHLALLFPASAGFIELRVRAVESGRWTQYFRPVANVESLLMLALRLSDDHEVYVGVLPRNRRGGGRGDLCMSAATVWADLDTRAATERVLAFEPEPTLVLGSGGPGHAHAYWRLDRQLPIAQIEALNSGLARRLGADEASTDAPRILRLGGTLAHKYDPPVVIRRIRTDFASHQPIHGRPTCPESPRVPSACRVPVAELLPLIDADSGSTEPLDRDPAGGPSTQPEAKGRLRRDRPGVGAKVPPGANVARELESVSPDVYVRALVGLEPDAHGKVRCPLHEDRTPSLHVYPTPEQGWYCFGCRRGGTVYDLAAAVWKRPVRGPGFLDLRDDLLDLLLPDIRRR